MNRRSLGGLAALAALATLALSAAVGCGLSVTQPTPPSDSTDNDNVDTSLRFDEAAAELRLAGLTLRSSAPQS